jgi:hypothetical protein
MGWFDNVTKWLDDTDSWVWKNTYERLPDWVKDSDRAVINSGKNYYGKGEISTTTTDKGKGVGGNVGAMASKYAQSQPPAGAEGGYGGMTPEEAAAFLASLGNSGDTGGGSGSGYNVKAMIDQINQSFDRQQQGLDAARGSGASNIQNAYNQFASNIGRNYSDYTGATQQSQAAMTQRLAQQIADAETRQREMQGSAQSMGQDIGALTQQQAGNVDTLRASSGFQQDLSQRMAQIVANNQRSLEGSGELVRQGASGNLEANYLGLLGALQSGREQALMSAQSGGGGGGGGGGSSKPTTAKDRYDELNYTQKAIALLTGGGQSEGAFAGVSNDKLWDWYQANADNPDESIQSARSQIEPYLADPTRLQ